MRLKEITEENKVYIALRGKDKLSLGSLYFTMLNISDAVKMGKISKSIWQNNFERFNAAIDEALNILNGCPDQRDSFVRNLTSVIKSYRDEIKDLNNELLNL